MPFSAIIGGDEMKATGRNREIVIQRATVTQDPGSGENVETWATFATVWAEMTPVSDGERIKAAEVSAEITTRFRILWSTTVSTVNPKDRLTFDGKTWDIWGVKEIGFREGIEITASARAD
jgi:SPP1 family predicted phage head-tail adaptor